MVRNPYYAGYKAGQGKRDVGEVFDGALPTPDDTMQSIADRIARAKAAFLARQLLGVSLAAPGFIDPAGKLVSQSSDAIGCCLTLSAVLFALAQQGFGLATSHPSADIGA